jgi:UDP-N-acetyl-D-glucosamine dehydrogenase
MNTLTKEKNKYDGEEVKNSILQTSENDFRENYFEKKRRKTVAVIGLGYVGLPLAILAAQNEYKVMGLDSDQEKIDLITKKISPFADKKISKYLNEVEVKATSNPEFLKDMGIIIVCVPTPVDEHHKPDFKPLENAALDISKNLSKDTLVIIESTVNPGVCESIVLPILENGSGLKAGKDFELSHCPERINPGDNNWDVSSINRVVGSLTKKGLKQTILFYESLIGKKKVMPMGSIKEAEAVKVVENSFRDINIAFVNELAMSFSLMGIDVVNVIKGASSKPFGFMAHYPGCGVGGHCIPVDPYYLIQYAKDNGFEHKFLLLARQINRGMPKFTIKTLEKALTSKNLPLKQGKIVVLGAAYKANIDDIRESPSFEIYKELEKNGYSPVMHDPHVNKNYMEKNIDEALKDSVAVIVATDHDEFKSLSPQYFLSKGIKVVVDGRNCLQKESFQKSNLAYRGIGR